jgi:hypothetical protein
MTTSKTVLAALLIGCGVAANAHDYPTMDRVDHVLTCMKQNGGQNIDNMLRCSCEIDVIAQQLSMEDFNTARTYEIYKNMPGEKGGLFRESADGSAAVNKLDAARKDAAKRCFVGATRQTVVPTDQGVTKKPRAKVTE